MSTVITTVTLSDEVVQAAALVGRLVTLPYDDTQFVIYSVEGPDCYAFRSDVQSITIDPSMTRVDWIKEPHLTLLPTWAKIGQGFGVDARLSQVRFGVSLVKPWV